MLAAVADLPDLEAWLPDPLEIDDESGQHRIPRNRAGIVEAFNGLIRSVDIRVHPD